MPGSAAARVADPVPGGQAVADFTAGAGVAFLSSVPSTMLYFASYEAIKRTLTPWTPDWAAHLAAGGMGDVIASAAVAPWEVVKTRLQLQGRYNNPLRRTEYNYRSWPNAMWSLYRYEGVASLFHGLGATCLRDAPFSALQFAIYGATLPSTPALGWYPPCLTLMCAAYLHGFATARAAQEVATAYGPT